MRDHNRVTFLCICLCTGLLPVLMLGGDSHAQATLGAREVGLGRAASALNGSPWALFANPAMIDQQSSSISFFSLRYYGFEELTDMGVVANFVTTRGSIGFGAYRYGDDLFNENRIGLGYKNSYEGFHYGVSVSYYHLVMGDDYGSVGAPGLDVGLGAVLSARLWIAATAVNVNRPSYGSYLGIEEELPRSLIVGISYRLSDKALFAAEAFKDVRFPISCRAGVEVTLLQKVQVRAGVTTEPVTFAGGFGYSGRRWGLNVVVQQHENPVLGLSPGADLQVRW